MTPRSPKGSKLLIVENDEMNAQLMMFQLEDEGYQFVGPAPTVAKALALCESDPPQLAILDYRLQGETVERVAAVLEARRTPYVLVTGAVPANLAKDFPGARVLTKPFQAQQLIEILRTALGG